MKLAELKPEQRTRRVLVYGGASAFISALTTWYYLLSLFLYPVYLILLILSVQLTRKSPGSLTSRHFLGLGLAIGAALMPLAGYIGLTFISDLDPKDTGWNHHPMFYAYTSALVVLVASVIVTMTWRKRSEIPWNPPSKSIMSEADQAPRHERSMLPAYLGWAIGGLLIAASQPLAFSFGPFALVAGLLVTLWVTIRAPRHRVIGAIGSIGLGLSLGIAVLGLLIRNQA